MEYQGWDEILMITLISRKKLGVYKIMRNTVYSRVQNEDRLELVIHLKDIVILFHDTKTTFVNWLDGNDSLRLFVFHEFDGSLFFFRYITFGLVVMSSFA